MASSNCLMLWMDEGYYIICLYYRGVELNCRWHGVRVFSIDVNGWHVNTDTKTFSTLVLATAPIQGEVCSFLFFYYNEVQQFEMSVGFPEGTTMTVSNTWSRFWSTLNSYLIELLLEVAGVSIGIELGWCKFSKEHNLLLKERRFW